MTDILVNPTVTTTQPTPPLKRCAIIGTAQSWKEAPFDDKTLEIWGLNDAYMIGVPRADRWFDLHPFHQMVFRPVPKEGPGSSGFRVDPLSVPVGCYLRPQGHLEWLKSRPMPVYLMEARKDAPTSRTFPKEDVLRFFAKYWPWRLTRTKTIEAGPDYEVSTPSWMLMLAILEGYQEIHVYGIHLATQWEYIEQRPNFEFLLGIAAARGIKIVLPSSTPICKAKYRYAFEPKADIPLQQIEQDIQVIKMRGMKVKTAHAQTPWYRPLTKKALERKAAYVDVLLADARQRQSRLQVQIGA